MMPTLRFISVLALASFVVHPESGDKVHLFLGMHFVPFSYRVDFLTEND